MRTGQQMGGWKLGVGRALLLAVLCIIPATLRADVPYAPVMIYYDQTNAVDNGGKIGVNALRNLLGHFKTTVEFTNVASYTTGQLKRYMAVFYIGSAFDPTNIPGAFLNDVMASTTTVVWLHYNLWQLPNVTSGANRLGIHYTDGNVANGYSAVYYKSNGLAKIDDLVQISVSNFVLKLAIATNTAKHLTSPYAVRASNFWYIADDPLTTQQLGDRSLVLADLLHDILGSGTNFSHRGLARIEDIAPALTDTSAVAAVSTALRGLGINATFGIIPRYRDPQGTYTNQGYPADLSMSDNRGFLRVLCGVQRDGGEFTDHGYTHESGDAESGSGYEFWCTNTASPLAYDSWDWCAGRVTNGLSELLRSAFPVTCWETVHYEAALDDYPAFSETYRYSHERARVFAAFADGVSKSNLSAVSATNPSYSDQWFPYVIQKSCYGNTFLPENIDRFSTSGTDGNGMALSVSNKILYAKRLSVVRDAVVGFYFHPQYGVANLTNIVRQVASVGYTFVSDLALSRDEPVALYTNAAWAASNTNRIFKTATNLTADLVVGDAGGSNRVTITNGIAVANEEALLGLQTASRSNLVTVANPGSAWTSRRILSVGRHGPANAVTVRNGGSVRALETVLGFYPDSSGNTATVSDAASVWSNRYGFTIGYGSASNRLTVSAGARVSGEYGELGATTNANSNVVTITDSGSVWSNSQYVVVGNAGAANTLTIQSSGLVSSAFGLIGARSTAASNAVQVTGLGACWTNTAGLFVGIDAGHNSLVVSNGGTVACGSAVVGDFDKGVGNRIDVQGGNATFRVQQDLTIGGDGSSNVVHVGQGGVAQCGSITVGRDAPGPGNELIVDGGSVTATGAVQVFVGRLTLTNGSLQVDTVVLASGSTLSLAPGFDWRAGALTLPGNFSYSGTNAGPGLLHATLSFATGGVHRLELDAQDRGASLAGFSDNRALGALDVESAATVTNVCYVWALSGAGVLTISPGARVYYVSTNAWHGAVVLQGSGAFVQVPVRLDALTRPTASTVQLAWPSASGLTFNVEWAARLFPASPFLNATSLLSGSTTQTWTDFGDTNRPPPSSVTQRFYRINAAP